MNVRTIEKRLISVLTSLQNSENEHITRFHSYRFVKKFLTTKSRLIKYFDLKISDTRYVKNYINEKVLVDAGCGAGAFSLMLSLLDAKKVYAVDNNADCIEMTKAVVKIAALDNIQAVHSDVGKLYLPPKSVDGIFCIEGISHFKDYKSFLTMASKVLKRGGFLFIRDGNNSISPYIKKTFKIWHVFENCPKGTSIFDIQTDNICYLDIRKRIIKNSFSTLSEEEVEKFAKYTFAYSKEEVIAAVKQFVKGNFSLKSEYSYGGKCPLNPETNSFIELLFNPVDLKHELRNYGFESKIKSRGPTSRNVRLLRYIWEICSTITIFLPGGFQLIAIKISERT